jgi:hypothetical protein
MTYVPTQLPGVDTVEVLVLSEETDDSPTQLLDIVKWQKFPVSFSIEVSGDVAQEIANLWRHLPPDEQMRCHLPPFGLRFYAKRMLLLESSICWQCNNIWIKMNGKNATYTFDGSHEVSQKLLATLAKVTKQRGITSKGI